MCLSCYQLGNSKVYVFVLVYGEKAHLQTITPTHTCAHRTYIFIYLFPLCQSLDTVVIANTVVQCTGLLLPDLVSCLSWSFIVSCYQQFSGNFYNFVPVCCHYFCITCEELLFETHLDTLFWTLQGLFVLYLSKAKKTVVLTDKVVILSWYTGRGVPATAPLTWARIHVYLILLLNHVFVACALVHYLGLL